MRGRYSQDERGGWTGGNIQGKEEDEERGGRRGRRKSAMHPTRNELNESEEGWENEFKQSISGITTLSTGVLLFCFLFVKMIKKNSSNNKK